MLWIDKILKEWFSISGNLKISSQYEKVGFHFQNGVISAMKNGKWGMINTNGNTVVDFKYDEFDQYSTFCRGKIGNKWGAFDSKGKELFGCKYDEIDWVDTTYNYFPVTLNGQKGYVDFYGNDTF